MPKPKNSTIKKVAPAKRTPKITDKEELYFIGAVLDEVIEDWQNNSQEELEDLNDFNSQLQEKSSLYIVDEDEDGNLSLREREADEPAMTFKINFIPLDGNKYNQVGVNYSFVGEERTASSTAIATAMRSLSGENEEERPDNSYSINSLCDYLGFDKEAEEEKLVEQINEKSKSARNKTRSKDNGSAARNNARGTRTTTKQPSDEIEAAELDSIDESDDEDAKRTRNKGRSQGDRKTNVRNNDRSTSQKAEQSSDDIDVEDLDDVDESDDEDAKKTRNKSRSHRNGSAASHKEHFPKRTEHRGEIDVEDLDDPDETDSAGNSPDEDTSSSSNGHKKGRIFSRIEKNRHGATPSKPKNLGVQTEGDESQKDEFDDLEAETSVGEENQNAATRPKPESRAASQTEADESEGDEFDDLEAAAAANPTKQNLNPSSSKKLIPRTVNETTVDTSSSTPVSGTRNGTEDRTDEERTGSTLRQIGGSRELGRIADIMASSGTALNGLNMLGVTAESVLGFCAVAGKTADAIEDFAKKCGERGQSEKLADTIKELQQTNERLARDEKRAKVIQETLAASADSSQTTIDIYPPGDNRSSKVPLNPQSQPPNKTSSPRETREEEDSKESKSVEEKFENIAKATGITDVEPPKSLEINKSASVNEQLKQINQYLQTLNLKLTKIEKRLDEIEERLGITSPEASIAHPEIQQKQNPVGNQETQEKSLLEKMKDGMLDFIGFNEPQSYTPEIKISENLLNYAKAKMNEPDLETQLKEKNAYIKLTNAVNDKTLVVGANESGEIFVDLYHEKHGRVFGSIKDKTGTIEVDECDLSKKDRETIENLPQSREELDQVENARAALNERHQPLPTPPSPRRQQNTQIEV